MQLFEAVTKNEAKKNVKLPGVNDCDWQMIHTMMYR